MAPILGTDHNVMTQTMKPARTHINEPMDHTNFRQSGPNFFGSFMTELSTPSTSTTPEIVHGVNVPVDQMDREQLAVEVNKLRNLVAELSEDREGDRKSILILQEQIDSIRNSSKCSDSVESSFALLGSLVACAWNKLPSIPVPSFQQFLKKGRFVSSSSKSSQKSSRRSAKGTPSLDRGMSKYPTAAGMQINNAN